MKTYKQLKDLPFTKKGSLWEVVKDKVSINGSDYSGIPFATAMVKYYTEESGVINMEGDGWFELGGDKELQTKKERSLIESVISYHKSETEKLEDSLKQLS